MPRTANADRHGGAWPATQREPVERRAAARPRQPAAAAPRACPSGLGMKAVMLQSAAAQSQNPRIRGAGRVRRFCDIAGERRKSHDVCKLTDLKHVSCSICTTFALDFRLGTLLEFTRSSFHGAPA